MKHPMRNLGLLAVVLGLAFAPACSKEESAPKDSATASAVPATFWSATEPAGALGVKQAHAQSKHGDKVVVVGRVGGDAQVFFDKTGVFTLVDSALMACSDEGDPMAGSCETPWDYCCIDPKTKRESTATVELRQDGQVLKLSPRGFHGLDHLSTVVVTGKVERDEQGNFVVAAESLHVKP